MAGLPEPTEWASESMDVIEEHDPTQTRPIGFWRAWKLPGVIPVTQLEDTIESNDYSTPWRTHVSSLSTMDSSSGCHTISIRILSKSLLA